MSPVAAKSGPEKVCGLQLEIHGEGFGYQQGDRHGTFRTLFMGDSPSAGRSRAPGQSQILIRLSSVFACVC